MNVGQIEERAETLRALGLDKAPEPRLDGLKDQPPPGSALLKFKKALQLVDAIETAAFTKYIPDDIIIDQTEDARVFHPEASKCVMLRTDVPIPSNRRVFASTGIGTEPNAHNHYLWLALELRRHVLEMGARATAPPLLFRTNGADGTVPFLGLIIKLIDQHPDEGATWALLGKRAPEVRLDEGETVADVK